MTVYVDDMQRPARVGRLTAQWSHLIADSDDELHAFAGRLGLKRAWHQKPGTPISHYDVTEPKRQLAIKLGAVPIGYMSEESKALIRRKIAQRDTARTDSGGTPMQFGHVPCPCDCGRRTDEHLCPCGCGHNYDEAVRNIMGGTMALNWYQASTVIDEHPDIPCKWHRRRPDH